MQAQFNSFINTGARMLGQAANAVSNEFNICKNNFNTMTQERRNETAIKAAAIGFGVGVFAAVALSNPVILGLSASAIYLYKATRNYTVAQAVADHGQNVGDNILNAFGFKRTRA